MILPCVPFWRFLYFGNGVITVNFLVFGNFGDCAILGDFGIFGEFGFFFGGAHMGFFAILAIFRRLVGFGRFSRFGNVGGFGGSRQFSGVSGAFATLAFLASCMLMLWRFRNLLAVSDDFGNSEISDFVKL